jgi:hypothetical protein
MVTKTNSDDTRQLSLSGEARKLHVTLSLSRFAADELRRLLQSIVAMDCENQAYEEILRQLGK